MCADVRRITFFMDNVPFIFDDMTDFPYVGSIQHEKEIVRSLMNMPLDYLRQNYEAFDDIGLKYITSALRNISTQIGRASCRERV